MHLFRALILLCFSFTIFTFAQNQGVDAIQLFYGSAAAPEHKKEDISFSAGTPDKINSFLNDQSIKAETLKIRQAVAKASLPTLIRDNSLRTPQGKILIDSARWETIRKSILETSNDYLRNNPKPNELILEITTKFAADISSELSGGKYAKALNSSTIPTPELLPIVMNKIHAEAVLVRKHPKETASNWFSDIPVISRVLPIWFENASKLTKLNAEFDRTPEQELNFPFEFVRFANELGYTLRDSPELNTIYKNYLNLMEITLKNGYFEFSPKGLENKLSIKKLNEISDDYKKTLLALSVHLTYEKESVELGMLESYFNSFANKTTLNKDKLAPSETPMSFVEANLDLLRNGFYDRFKDKHSEGGFGNKVPTSGHKK